MNTIVVGYAGASESSQRTLERSAELAHAFAAELIVVSAVVPEQRLIPNPIIPAEPIALPMESVRDQLQTTEDDLERARSFLADRGIEAELVQTLGAPVEAIIETAEERGADLIVVGTREPTFLQRLLEGSVSEDVSRRAHCDVLIVH